jgi:site-specific recombinase XerC
MRDLLPAFLLHLKSQNRSARTMTTYEAILVLFSDATTARTPSRIDVEAFLARPCLGGRHRAPATRNLDLAALRAFAKLAVRELGWTTNPTDGIPFVRDAARDPAVLTAPELRRLFSIAAEASRPGERSRNLALLAVLGQLGLRVHELVHLDVEQLDFASATLVGVRGKGGTVHDLPLNTPTVAFLTRWLAERGSIALADEPALFVFFAWDAPLGSSNSAAHARAARQDGLRQEDHSTHAPALDRDPGAHDGLGSLDGRRALAALGPEHDPPLPAPRR